MWLIAQRHPRWFGGNASVMIAAAFGQQAGRAAACHDAKH